MRYLVKLKPLKPFFFGGDVTFGKLGDEESGTYLVHSRLFPQQSAVLGMLRKEILLQNGLLNIEIDKNDIGEKIDKEKIDEVAKLIGERSFNIKSETIQDFGAIKKISPVFLIKNGKRFIKRANVAEYKNGVLKVYKNGELKNYNPKNDIFDNFISIDDNESLKTDDIFKSVTQVGIKKIVNKENNDAYYKRTAYLFNDNFQFAFYLDIDIKLKPSFVKLGADDSVFKMEIEESSDELDYQEKDDYLLLLSDAYITIPLKGNCEFAITKEISYQNLTTNIKEKYKFKKSEKVYFYEKGSIIIKPEEKLLENMAKENLQKIGYNIIIGGKK
jgi:CRISPR-associated protein Cmr3